MDKPQIQIKLEKSEDSQIVERILVAAAEKFGLVDNSVTSRVPNTIRSFVEGVGFGFGIGARNVESLILIDFNPRTTQSEKFNAVYNQIVSDLRESFAERFAFATPGNYIKSEGILSLSEAGEKFVKQNFSQPRSI
jgi:hypothetical protein